MRTVKWFDWDSGELAGAFPDSWTDSYEWPDMFCPQCGKPCQYVEGQVGQDEQGNEITGCWWICGDCRITSDDEEL